MVLVGTNLHTLGMVELLVAVDVVVCYLLLTHPALLLSLAVALAAARLVLSHEEDLTQLDAAVFTPAGREGERSHRGQTCESQNNTNLKHALW